jgi:hypothetical protein
MRAWEVGMLALIPWLPLSDEARRPAPPCELAIEIEVHIPVGRSTFDWKLVTGEVERVWAPYGISFCWSDGSAGCEGVAVHLRVLVTGTIEPARELTPARQAVGQIQFDRTGPGRIIRLSLDGARRLVEEAVLGDRRLGDWPASTVDTLVSRVLGRALAHEIGHCIFGSRAHTTTGLMAGSFRPDEATLGATSRFRLSTPAASIARAACAARGSQESRPN